MGLVLDVVELQDGILFVTGYLDNGLTVGQRLTHLSVFQANKKQHKKLSEVAVDLVVDTILVQGEPLDAVDGGLTAHIGLKGDTGAIEVLMSDHQWHEKNGRYLLPRNETRLIILSGD